MIDIYLEDSRKVRESNTSGGFRTEKLDKPKGGTGSPSQIKPQGISGSRKPE